jgi:stage V sporulation protein G
MRVTKCEVALNTRGNSRLAGFANIELDGCFAVNGMKIIHNTVRDYYFVAMPQRESKEGRWYDVCHPTNQEAREMIEEAVLEEFERVQAREGVGSRQ